MGSLFTFYFGFIYYYQKKFLRRVKYSMSSAEALWKCPLALKSTTVYTFESIIRGKECKLKFKNRLECEYFQESNL